MKISIYNHDEDILVQTISVQKNKARPLNTFLFFCPYCSYQLFQLQGDVNKITPGLEPTESVVVVTKCPRCEMRYTVQEFQTESDRARVILTQYENKETSFRCYICRTPLLQFKIDELYLLPFLKKVELPVSIICPNSNCPAKYYIVDVV